MNSVTFTLFLPLEDRAARRYHWIRSVLARGATTEESLKTASGEAFPMHIGKVAAGVTIVISALNGSCHPISPLKANDALAKETVHLISVAEQLHREKHGRFALLPELVQMKESGLSRELASGEARGYQFRVTLTQSGYTIEAWPKEQMVTGFRSFYTDESGEIRHRVSSGVATKKSPPLSLPPD